MDELRGKCNAFNDGLITSRELLGHFIEIIGAVWHEGTDENETEAIARLAVSLSVQLLK